MPLKANFSTAKSHWLLGWDYDDDDDDNDDYIPIYVCKLRIIYSDNKVLNSVIHNNQVNKRMWACIAYSLTYT